MVFRMFQKSNCKDPKSFVSPLSLWITLCGLFFLVVIAIHEIYNGDYAGVATSVKVAEIDAKLDIQKPSLESLNSPNKKPKEIKEIGSPFIEEAILLPDDILLLVRTNGKRDFDQSSLQCSFSDRIHTSINAIEYLDSFKRAAFRCRIPQRKWSANSVSITGVPSSTATEIVSRVNYSEPLNWNFLVYEIWTTETDIVLFAKGINTRQSNDVEVDKMKCIFGDRIETQVTSSAQEVFRCRHPHESVRESLAGLKVSLLYKETFRSAPKPVPSVAIYTQNPHPEPKSPIHHDLCACTMVYNVSKYVKEWLIYNAHIGVTKFFLYDNNSEDVRDLDRNIETAVVLSKRLSNQTVTVTRRPWLWSKTQEAGFSHCALLGKDSHCKWMMYTDVDEFPVSRSWEVENKRNKELSVNNATRDSTKGVLKELVKSLETREGDALGQIAMSCRNFGPSGQTAHPKAGVTQGYTCREKSKSRHKSVVRLDAVDYSLRNVVHHFHLQHLYLTYSAPVSMIVVNHYKYQAWTEFKVKFRRRVAAYVADWKEPCNLTSRDRTPGLGTRPVKPQGWEKRFCQVNDTNLKKFVLSVFSSSPGGALPWQ